MAHAQGWHACYVSSLTTNACNATGQYYRICCVVKYILQSNNSSSCRTWCHSIYTKVVAFMVVYTRAQYMLVIRWLFMWYPNRAVMSVSYNMNIDVLWVFTSTQSAALLWFSWSLGWCMLLSEAPFLAGALSPCLVTFVSPPPFTELYMISLKTTFPSVHQNTYA